MPALTEKPVRVSSITAREIIPSNRFVSAKGYVCNEGEKSIGVSGADYDNPSQSVVSVVTEGLKIVEVGRRKEIGAKDVEMEKPVASDINGRLRLWTSGSAVNGYLKEIDECGVYALVQLI